jgi:CheY-like chemotaxis protein
VDDQEDVRDVMVAYLEMLGHRTVEASSGRMAIAMLNELEASAIDLLLVPLHRDYATLAGSG